ncbi:hypothetical protein AUQ48_10400 [Kocuria flava]|uniref:Uncharacterized protein n=1 Tax=Kocuria flava TaxID=446860 RepID=A0A2N4T2U9_9MICC|nr:hypothetical protein [Kocuria flava]PLC12557.1 hypothetical protein AUQ48_10400 [Kocuria flava]
MTSLPADDVASPTSAWDLAPATVPHPEGADAPAADAVARIVAGHRLIGALAEGPGALQLMFLADAGGRLARAAEDGTVEPGCTLDELSADLARQTGRGLQAEHPGLRRVLLVRLDAPELPVLAALSQTGFTAVSRHGWSVVVFDDEVDYWAVRTGLGEPAVVLSSDGATRSAEVLLAGEDPADVTDLEAADAVCALEWGPEWRPAGGPAGTGRGTPAARFQDDLVRLCAAGTSELQVESVASVFDLDPAETNRLRNYVAGDSTELVLESVLQLLGLPVLAAKVVEGRRELAELEDAEHYAPTGVGPAVLRAMTIAPTGDGLLDRCRRALVHRPGLVLAVAGAETAVGVGLAGAARRGGAGARVLGTLSAALLADAAAEGAWWAALRAARRERARAAGPADPGPAPRPSAARTGLRRFFGLD